MSPNPIDAGEELARMVHKPIGLVAESFSSHEERAQFWAGFLSYIGGMMGASLREDSLVVIDGIRSGVVDALEQSKARLQ